VEATEEKGRGPSFHRRLPRRSQWYSEMAPTLRLEGEPPPIYGEWIEPPIKGSSCSSRFWWGISSSMVRKFVIFCG
jgi:hypothetical protein